MEHGTRRNKQGKDASTEPRALERAPRERRGGRTSPCRQLYQTRTSMADHAFTLRRRRGGEAGRSVTYSSEDAPRLMECHRMWKTERRLRGQGQGTRTTRLGTRLPRKAPYMSRAHPRPRTTAQVHGGRCQGREAESWQLALFVGPSWTDVRTLRVVRRARVYICILPYVSDLPGLATPAGSNG